MWDEVLGTPVGPDDDFLELGCDSQLPVRSPYRGCHARPGPAVVKGAGAVPPPHHPRHGQEPRCRDLSGPEAL
ncbi:hypothetical protein ACKI2B_47120, partial [Streptomyces scabiei]